MNKLSKLIDELIGRLNVLQEPKNPDVIQEEMEGKLENIKNQMHELIEQEFLQLRENIKVRVGETNSILKNLEEIHHSLEMLINQLRDTFIIIS